ncbi:TPA: fimbria/pilus periplasmic chaperone [Vibrio cholerae]|nr:fimbria/pilus periplasmic chaperone [Vibrio cholerae]HDI3275972.1 fimbria/pilus periplasmic chaperone [Vibrio cholerae]
MKKQIVILGLMSSIVLNYAFAGVSLDRTRVIYVGGTKSMTINIHNNSDKLPFLAQAWLEDSNGHKISSPFIVLPPIQRLEPNMDSLVKIQALANVDTLPKDRESLFYFNLREIPPRNEKPNTLQLALQSRIKFFYRPQALIDRSLLKKKPWQEEVTLHKIREGYELHNPTPYYVTFTSLAIGERKNKVDSFEPVMVSPYGVHYFNTIHGKNKFLLLTYINDFGGSQTLKFKCDDVDCKLVN